MRQRRSSFLVVSIAVHAVLVLGLVVMSILAPGLLPMPREVLAYHATDRIVRIADIELPRSASARTPAKPGAAIVTDMPVAAAPVVAPVGIAAETGREGVLTAPAGLSAVEQGITGVDGGNLVEALPPQAPTPREPVRLHIGIQAPRKIVDAAPRYPEIARATQVQGMVILEVVIDEHGDVTSARVLRSVRLLDDAALAAVRSWKFAPARLNGEAIPVVMTVTVNFTLQR